MSDVPHANSLVKSTRNKQIGVRVVVETKNKVGMSDECLDADSLSNIWGQQAQARNFVRQDTDKIYVPYHDSLVIRCRCKI